VAHVEGAQTPLTVLGALDPEAPSPLGRSSLLRRMVAEPVTALLVQRVLVMDVAHPSVAAAVGDHSRFEAHPWRRTGSTIDVALRLVFGSSPTARAAVRQVYAVHDTIHGDTVAGTAYTAHDASLLAWVWATLVDSVELAYTRWVRPLSADEADTYYAEMVAFGRFLGIPAALLPPDRAAFAVYLYSMLDDDRLGSDDRARELAGAVLWFEHRTVPSPVVRVGRVLAVTTLDPRLRRRLALRLDAGDERLAARLDAVLRTYYRRLPRARPVLPALYVALRRPTVGLGRRLRAVGPRL